MEADKNDIEQSDADTQEHIVETHENDSEMAETQPVVDELTNDTDKPEIIDEISEQCEMDETSGDVSASGTEMHEALAEKEEECTATSKAKKDQPTIDLSEYLNDNTKSVVLKGDIPDIVKEEPCLLGIDEAGRGPVLGPMVYGTCFCPISKKDEMKDLGFDDSKVLTEEKREELLVKILENNNMMSWMVHILSPNTISTSMLRRCKYNLNALSHDTAIGLIQAALDGGANITEVYVDTVGDPTKYQDKLKGLFPQLDITVAKKADSTYPIVSAASICAKVVRDHCINQWKCIEETNIPETGYGSGYPGDDKTKKFLHSSLDSVFGFPQIVRFSWSTASKILEEKACEMQWEDDDDEESENAKGMSNISSYFKSGDGPKRHVYFEDRRLYSVSGF